MFSFFCRFRAAACWCFIGVLLLPCLHATTVRAPDFNELVHGADRIVRGSVTRMRSYRVQAEGRAIIRTEVTVQVHETLAGPSAGDELTLRLLGGQADGKFMRVEGMPAFEVGREFILFVAENGRRICPLVGWRHGQYRIELDASSGQRVVFRADGSALEGTSEVLNALGVRSSREQRSLIEDKPKPMTLTAFVAAIRAERGGEHHAE